MSDILKDVSKTPLTLLRRSEIWASHECDYNDPATNGEKFKITIYRDFKENDGSLLTDSSGNAYNDGEFNLKYSKMYPDDVDSNERYYSLRSNYHGEFSIGLNLNEQDFDTFYEFYADYRVYGPGELSIRKFDKNNKFLKNELVIASPCSWKSTHAIRLGAEDYLRCRFLNKGVSDPSPYGEIDHLRLYRYEEVYADFTEYACPVLARSPRVVETLRGFSTYQTDLRVDTKIETSLYFYSDYEHNKFLQNAHQVHMIIDNSGVIYRGMLELGDCDYIAPEVCIQAITLLSPYRIGEGWV